MDVFGRTRARSRDRAHGGVSGVLWYADFSALAAGGTTTLPDGLAFTRASDGHTVQTAEATVALVTAGNDVARIGRRAAADPLALVLEEARTNLLKSSRAHGSTGWTTGGTTASTPDAGNGPDGSAVADRSSVAGGAFGPYQAVTVSDTAAYTCSLWLRATSGTSTYQMFGTATAFGFATGTATTTYRRVAATLTAGGTSLVYEPNDGRDLTGSGGIVDAARDVLIDLHQVEAGAFATEAIVTTAAAATRAGERLRITATVIVAGRLALEIDCQPKGARADYAAAARVWTRGTDYAEIEPTTGVLTVSIGGVTNTTSALTWSANDHVQLYVAAGGARPTTVSYRVNNGATITPTVTGSALGALSAGDVDVLSDGTSSQLSCWLRAVRAWR